MKSKSKRFVFLIVPLLTIPVLYSLLFSGSNRAAEEAMSWFPAETRSFAFDNWAQIKKDFGFDSAAFRKGDWAPEMQNPADTELPEEKKKDNLSHYANVTFLNAHLSAFARQCGLIYPEMEWEAMGDNLTVIKTGKFFSVDAFEQQLKERKYQQEQVRGQTIWWYNFKDTLAHPAVLPMAYLADNLVYFKEEQVLLVSHSKEILIRSMEAHLKKKSLKERAGVKDLLNGSGSYENIFIHFQPYAYGAIKSNDYGLSEADALRRYCQQIGVSNEELKKLNKPAMLLFGEEKNGQVFSKLMFETAAEAVADKAPREKIMQNGRSLITQQAFKEIIKNLSVDVSGKMIKFQWQTNRAASYTQNAYFNYDFPWGTYLNK